MPCYDSRSEDISNSIKRDLDTLTDLMCQCGKAYTGGTPLPREVLLWWKNHAKEDASRGDPWPSKMADIIKGIK